MMGDSEGPKLSGIWQIVRLKEFLHKWQAVTLGSKEERTQLSTQEDISPSISKRLTDVQCGDSDEEEEEEEGSGSPEPPGGIPKGYLAVYVGKELRRFVIPTAYLSHPLFKVLLEKVEEEYGFNHSGGLTIPCEIETFKYLLQCMENKNRASSSDISEQMAAVLSDNPGTQSRG